MYFSGYPKWDAGFTISGGHGPGFNVGLSVPAVALIPGDASKIGGVTTNINVSATVLSGTVMKDPQTGETVGKQISPGAKFGISRTTSKTATYGVRDFIGYLKSKFSSEKPEPKPEPKPKLEPIRF